MRSGDAGVRYVNPPSLERPPGYSHVVDVHGGRLIFIAGQAGVDAVGTVVGGDNLEAQADQAFRNLSAALEEVSLQRCKHGEAHRLHVRHEQAGRLPPCSRSTSSTPVSPPVAPAITLVEVSRLYSEGLLIEIEAVAAA